MKRFYLHVRDHPLRLFATTAAILVTSWVFAGTALWFTLGEHQRASVAVCRSVNELRRQIYVAARDLGVQPVVAERFLPTENCERLP